MSNADLIKRLRVKARRAMISQGKGVGHSDEQNTIEAEAADALEQCERRSVEYVHEINKLKLIIQRLERKR